MRRLSAVAFVLFIASLLGSSILQADETPTPEIPTVEPPTATLEPTWTPSPTLMPEPSLTWTPVPTSTETTTLTPSETFTATPEMMVSLSPSITSTAELSATAALDSSASETLVTSSPTPTGQGYEADSIIVGFEEAFAPEFTMMQLNSVPFIPVQGSSQNTYIVDFDATLLPTGQIRLTPPAVIVSGTVNGATQVPQTPIPPPLTWSDPRIVNNYVETYVTYGPTEVTQRVMVTLPGVNVTSASGAWGVFRTWDSTNYYGVNFDMTLNVKFYSGGTTAYESAPCIKETATAYVNCTAMYASLSNLNLIGITGVEYVMVASGLKTSPGASNSTQHYKRFVMDSFSITTSGNNQEISCSAPDRPYAFVANTDPGRTQVTLDMKAIANTAGLIVHDGPTLNANRFSVVPWGRPEAIEIDRWFKPDPSELWYRATAFTNEDNLRFIWQDFDGPGSQRYWVIYDPSSGEQIRWNAFAGTGMWQRWDELATPHWQPASGVPMPSGKEAAYKQLFTQLNLRDSLGNAVENDLWVNARWDATHQYLEGVNGDNNNNPCAGVGELTTTEKITFYYDREATAKYAMAHAYRNSEIDMSYIQEANQVTAKITDTDLAQGPIPYADQIPFFDFRFYTNYAAGATGSAYFTNQSVWMGGMPMTKDKTGDERCEGTEIEPYTPLPNEEGWKHCGYELSSKVFSNHDGLMAFLSETDPSARPSISTFRENIDIVAPHGKFISNIIITNAGDASLKVSITNIVGYIQSGLEKDIADKEGLYNELNILSIKDYIKTGDYTWTSRDHLERHGFLVVGWGPIVKCSTALSTIWDLNLSPVMGVNNHLYKTHQAAINAGDSTIGNYPVPYVVDFSRSYNAVGGQVQRPRPRPFYCTQFRDYTYQYSWDGFWFNTLPDYVKISVDLVYPSSNIGAEQ